jgi:hypothetical protein
LAGGVAVAQSGSSAKFQRLFTQYFETCMKDRDKATHMSKAEWSRTCRLLADQRARFRIEHGFEPKWLAATSVQIGLPWRNAVMLGATHP